MTLAEMLEQAVQFELLAKASADKKTADAYMEKAEAYFENACAAELQHNLMRQHGFVEIIQ